MIKLIPERSANELLQVEKLLEKIFIAQNRLETKVYETLLSLLKNDESVDDERARILNNFSTCLSDTGQREDALKAALKAVEIYDKLAGKKPDAFEPVLAMSFGSKGAILSNGEDIPGAAESFFMGVVKLRRLFLAQPGPYARIMGNLCQGYITACEKLKIAPDMETLSEIIEVFKYLNQ